MTPTDKARKSVLHQEHLEQVMRDYNLVVKTTTPDPVAAAKLVEIAHKRTIFELHGRKT